MNIEKTKSQERKKLEKEIKTKFEEFHILNEEDKETMRSNLLEFDNILEVPPDTLANMSGDLDELRKLF